jgi:hypothetical protein
MTFAADAHLARVGFMNGRDVEALVEHVEDRGLRLLADGRCAYIAVVDAARGPSIHATGSTSGKCGRQVSGL